MRQLSGLYEPLRVQVEVLASGAEWQSLKTSLSGADVFVQAGVPRPHDLNRLRFAKRSEGGRRFLRICTSAPVAGPVLDFLIRLAWDGGRLVKCCTLLLSPQSHASV